MVDDVKVIERIRFPPFGTDLWIPEHLPITEIESVEKDPPPGFLVGNHESWFVERIVEGKSTGVFDGESPSIVERQRTGWYLLPHPIHATARKFITYSVSILLISLLYLAFTPAMENVGIPTFGTKSLRLGLLDYPLLAVIVVPLTMIPIFLRIGANLGDLRRQRLFLNNAPKSPILELDEAFVNKPLKGKLVLPEKKDDWGHISISWRVGLLPPSREAVFKAQGRSEEG